MAEQPRAWIVASLNRLFDESGIRESDGSAPIPVSLMQVIAKRYKWIEVTTVLNELADKSYLVMDEAPDSAAGLYFGRIRALIPEG